MGDGAKGDLKAGEGGGWNGPGSTRSGGRGAPLTPPPPGASSGPRETCLPYKFHLRPAESKWAGLRQTSLF